MNTKQSIKDLIQEKYPDLINEAKPYLIHPYTKEEAKKLNVIVKPSDKKGKKIDVFTNKGTYLVSIGAKGYSDYPTYRFLEFHKLYPSGHANKRQELYKKRHAKFSDFVGSPSYYANKLLW